MLCSNRIKSACIFHGAKLCMYLCIWLCVSGVRLQFAVFTPVQIHWMHRFNEYSSCRSQWIIWFGFFIVDSLIIFRIHFCKPNRYNPLDMKCVFSTATVRPDRCILELELFVCACVCVSSVGVYYFDYFILEFECDARFICSIRSKDHLDK